MICCSSARASHADATQQAGGLDAEDFVLDGYPAVRGAFGAATAAECGI